MGTTPQSQKSLQHVMERLVLPTGLMTTSGPIIAAIWYQWRYFCITQCATQTHKRLQLRGYNSCRLWQANRGGELLQPDAPTAFPRPSGKRTSCLCNAVALGSDSASERSGLVASNSECCRQEGLEIRGCMPSQKPGQFIPCLTYLLIEAQRYRKGRSPDCSKLR